MKSHSQSRNSWPHRASRPKIRVALGAHRETRGANHARPFAHDSSLATVHCFIQSLAKQKRKPIQVTENKQQRLKAIASFCRVLSGFATRFRGTRNRHRSPRITTHQSLIAIHKSRVTNQETRYNRAFLRAPGRSNQKPRSAAGSRQPARHETGFGLRSSNIAALISRTKKDNA
jgi:hypothetical protein